MPQIKTEIQNFITERFLLGNAAGLTVSQSLLDTGVMDSTGVMELVLFLEEKYGFRVQDTELTPENLDSIEKIASFVSRKRQPVAGKNS